MTPILSLLQQRFSVRSFKPDPIPQEVIDDILQAGRLSPSGGNEQPWKFGVIRDPALICQIAEIAYQQEWIASAPLLIVLCTACVEDARGGRDIQLQRYPAQAQAIAAIPQELYHLLNQEEHQTKIPGTHMLLAALEHGVGACWVSRFDVFALAAVLHLPAGLLPTEMLVLGYPRRPLKPVRKKSIEELVFYDKWVS